MQPQQAVAAIRLEVGLLDTPPEAANQPDYLFKQNAPGQSVRQITPFTYKGEHKEQNVDFLLSQESRDECLLFVFDNRITNVEHAHCQTSAHETLEEAIRTAFQHQNDNSAYERFNRREMAKAEHHTGKMDVSVFPGVASPPLSTLNEDRLVVHTERRKRYTTPNTSKAFVTDTNSLEAAF